MPIIKKLQAIYQIGGGNAIACYISDRINKNNRIGKCFYDAFSNASTEDYPKMLKAQYYLSTGKELNLDNPTSFNEKIQWLKLHDSTPLKTKLADKYLARDWIKEKIGGRYLVPLLGVWDDFDQIDFSLLPDKFVLKCNHGSGWNLIVTDKRLVDFNNTRRMFERWMNTNFAFVHGCELHYKDITPRIIAEEYLESKQGLVDYRFYCFNGKPIQCWVDIFSGTPKHLRSIYDMEWNKLPIRCTWPDGGELLDNKPLNYELMKELAAILSKGFAFVRVDFFEVNGRLFMGEMTFTPMSGMGMFDPPEWDKKLGDLLTLPQEKSVV